MTLGDLCSKIVDCAHKTAPIQMYGDYFAVGTPAMRGNVINYAEARRIDRTTFEDWTARLRPREGDLLLAREAPVGPVVRIPSGENVAPGQRTVLLRPDEAVIDRRFLYYYLTSPARQADLLAKATGSTVPHLNVADVRALPTPDIPSLVEQRAIAEVLGALDDKIAANDRLMQTIKELLFAQFARLRVDIDVRDSDKIALGELVDLNPRLPAPSSDNAVYLDMKNLPDRAITVNSWGYRAPRGGARFQNGDTLLARITPCLENGKTGFVDFLSPNEVGIGSTEYIVMRARNNIPSSLPYFLAISPRFREFAIRHMVGTSGRQRLSAADLSNLELRRPNHSELSDFARVSKCLMPRVKAAVDESRVLYATRDALLPLLMSGKVRVRDAERVVEGVV